MKKNQKIYIFLIIIVFSFTNNVSSQSLGEFEVDETAFYAMTKQMSQFFSRFNNEEDAAGVKYLPSNPNYHNNEKRKQLLPFLFDQENPRTASTLRDFFIEDLTKNDTDNFIKFTGGRWYAEVSSTFEYQGKQVPVVLFLTIEKERLGSKWVLTNVYFQGFNKYFPVGDIAEKEKHFLHPMSHELDFMNIYKVFRDPGIVEYYAKQSYQPDYLTLFFYEVKLGRMKFISVDSMKFHIFQMQDWYFEISYFNRKGNNTGWLISNLMYVKENEKEPLIKFYEP